MKDTWYIIIFSFLFLLPVTTVGQWRKVIVGTLDNAWAVSAADLDGDGDIDVIGSDWNPPGEVAWFKNLGSGNFTKVTIDYPCPRPRAIFVSDIDQDSDTDILTVTDETEDLIIWYENNGSGSFTEHSVGSLNDGEDVFAIDLDGDNDIDVVAAALWGYEVAWYENNGSQVFTKHTIENTSAPIYTVWPVDLDGDTDIDIISGIGLNGSGLWWYENNGSQGFQKRMIDENFPVNDIWARDIDGDGDIDFFAASVYGGQFVWYENDGSQTFTSHPFTPPQASDPISIYGGDLDNDGDIDAVGACLVSNEVYWFENDGNQNFTFHLIDNAADGASEVYLVDMDGDTDLDVLASLVFANQLVWYQNLHPVGEAEKVSESKLKPILPSPFFRNEIIVKFTASSSSPLKIQIADAFGKIVYSQSLLSQPTSLTLQDKRITKLTPGIYFLSLSQAKGHNRTMKLIKLQ